MSTTTAQPQQRCPRSTPWGRAQDITKIADGIFFASTASHGGYYVSDRRLTEMPPVLRKDKFTPQKNWFEEDCECVRVVLGFPEHFGLHQEQAKDMLKRFKPEIYKEFYGS